MKKLEQRSKMITYCDRCNKEIIGTSSSVQYEGEKQLDFCCIYNSEIDKTCLDYHNEEMLESYKLTRKLNHK